MDEFKFVVKCFIFASLLMMFSQMKADGGITYEARLENFLTQSEAAHFMQQAAYGGVKAINKALLVGKAFLSERTSSFSEPTIIEKPATDNSY